MRIFSLAVVIFSAVCGAAQAQDLNDDELLSMFQAQRDAFNEARDSETGVTRSLTLVTVDNVDTPQDSVAQPAAPQVNADLQPLTPSSDGDVAVAAQTQQPALPGAADATPVVFGQLDPTLQINLFIKFAYDSAAIDDAQKPRLDRMCNVMKSSDIEVFQIVGHTDAAGSDTYNERLSRLRAEEVSRYLVGSCGIANNRLSTLGMGERFPINSANPRADENRRVEFQALS